MLSRAQIRTLIRREPDFDDITCSLRATGRQPKGIIRETARVVAIARKFNDEVARPLVLQMDRRLHEDPDYLPWDFVKKANEWGLYTLFLPKIFGGQGYSLSCAGYFIEELASVCLSMGNLVGVHYLGYTGLVSTWNMKLSNRISREVVAGEKSGDPCLISFAMTEPDAGTDSQNVEFMDTGSLACQAKPVDGGYVLNGSKIFISCGHLSTWHTVFAYTDLNKGAENMVVLAVRTGTAGFSFGKKEKKMGQKASVASELVFRDCFVPEENVVWDRSHFSRLSRGTRQTTEQLLAYIWGASRFGVGAFGAGAARGAYEVALQFAGDTEVDGTRLINHEWCQHQLAEMYKNVVLARLAYLEVGYANGLHGLWKLLNFKPLYYGLRMIPKRLADAVCDRMFESALITRLFQKFSFDYQSDEEINRVDGLGSLAKVAGTDAAVVNCRLALEIMGQPGVRHDHLAEKMMRDVKLLQIYEGTNEVNRINLFKRFGCRSCPGARSFCAANR
ncbi:MAG: acyl-CoA dehydrogenase family protein [Desulfosudaceae bacterium]